MGGARFRHRATEGGRGVRKGTPPLSKLAQIQGATPAYISNFSFSRCGDASGR